MILLAASILYLIATILGVWGASLLWRAWHSWRLQRRARRDLQAVTVAITPGKRRLGIALAVACLPISGAVFSFGDAVRREAHSSGDDLASFAVRGLVAVFALMGVGAVYIAFRFDPSRGRRRCCKCWYDMSATPGLRCPECGREARGERALFRTRRAPALLIVAAVIFGLGYATYVAPKAYNRGWVSAVPTTVLIAGFPWWSEHTLLYAESSLVSRCAADDLWDWQKSLLEWRAQRIVTRSDNLHDISIAAEFIEYDEDNPISISSRAVLDWMRATCIATGRDATAPYLPTEMPPGFLLPSRLGAVEEAAARLIISDGLQSSSGAFRKNATVWTSSIDSLALPHLPRLIEIMKDQTEDNPTRLLAVWAIQPHADSNDDAWAAILWAAKQSGDPLLVRSAHLAMGMMSRREADVLAALLAGTDDPEDHVAGRAALMYLNRAPNPCGVSLRLMEAMERRPGLAPFVAIGLARKCMNERMVRCIEHLLTCNDSSVQETAAWAASLTGAQGERLLPVLRAFSRYEAAGDHRWTSAVEAIAEIESALKAPTGSPEGQDEPP